MTIQYTELFMSRFEPSERRVALIDKLQEYYDETPDSVSNNDALKKYREFREWAKAMGYSTRDINHVKNTHMFNM